MHTQLYIPKTVTVGFTKRHDTFTGKLAYVIYTDHKGVLRKETSWNGWRDKSIEPVVFENIPTSGFTLNKGVQRDGYWGSGRSVIRVWDPRDFEFEISVDNLIGILMHADVSKRDIIEPCVFAWSGTELILLPTNSVEYQESVKHTNKQSCKVSAKELVPGYTYNIKRDATQVVYLGRFDRYDVKDVHMFEDGRSRYDKGPLLSMAQVKKKSKGHVFIDPTSNHIEVRDPGDYVSSVALEEVHPQFAHLIDEYYAHVESQPLVGITCSPSESYHARTVQLSDNLYVKLNVASTTYGVLSTTQLVDRAYMFVWYDTDTNTVEYTHESSNNSGYYMYSRPRYSARPAPGDVSLTDPAIVEIIRAINADWNAGVAAAVAADPGLAADYSKQTQLERTLRADIFAKHNISTLRYKLADGKVDNYHHL